MTAYDTTGDGVADAYDTTGDLQIDTFLEEPVVKDAKEELWQVAAANLRKTPQTSLGIRWWSMASSPSRGRRSTGCTARCVLTRKTMR